MVRNRVRRDHGTEPAAEALLATLTMRAVESNAVAASDPVKPTVTGGLLRHRGRAGRVGPEHGRRRGRRRGGRDDGHPLLPMMTGG